MGTRNFLRKWKAFFFFPSLLNGLRVIILSPLPRDSLRWGVLVCASLHGVLCGETCKEVREVG